MVATGQEQLPPSRLWEPLMTVAPYQPSPLTAVMSLLKSWEALQVELHGKYPLHCIKALHAYTHASGFLRVALVCLLTPLPCIILVTLADFIPLNDPRLGIFENYVFWLRDCLAVAMITIAILEQFRLCLPRLPLSNAEILGITAIATTAGVGSQFFFAYMIGFPLPFSPIFGELMWTPAVVVSCGFLWGKMLMRDRTLLGDMLEYVMVLMCQVALTLVYPAYIYVFSSLSGWKQNLFVLTLPIIKILTKNWIARFLNDLDHLKPEVVIFNIDVFSALYVSCSLTTRTSTSTTLIVMIVDAVQMWISIYDMDQLHAKVRAILARLPERPAISDEYSMLDVCIELLEDPRVRNSSRFKPKKLTSYLYRLAQCRSRNSVDFTPAPPVNFEATQELHPNTHLVPAKSTAKETRVNPEGIEKVAVSPRPTASMTLPSASALFG